MRLKMLRSKDNPQDFSIARTISVTGHLILSIGFVYMGFAGKLDWMMFLAYPAGAVTFYLPNWAIEMIKIWKGVDNAKKNDQV